MMASSHSIFCNILSTPIHLQTDYFVFKNYFQWILKRTILKDLLRKSQNVKIWSELYM